MFFWLLFSIAQGIKVRSLLVRKIIDSNLPQFIIAAVIEGLAVSLFTIELVCKKAKPEYSLLGEDEDHICPLEDANIFSILTFEWMTGTMKLGYKKFLVEEDLWNLRKIDTAKDNGERFNRAWEKQLLKKKPSLWIALFQSFGWPYGVAGAYKIVQDILNYSQPQLLRLLIAFIASYKTDSPQPVVRGAAIASSMFILSVIQTFTLHQYFQHTYETGMRFKTAVTAAIYKKSMILSNEGRASKTTGDIVNLQAVDAQRMQGRPITFPGFFISLTLLRRHDIRPASLEFPIPDCPVYGIFISARWSGHVCWYWSYDFDDPCQWADCKIHEEAPEKADEE